MPYTTPDTPRQTATGRAVLRWGTVTLIILAWAYALFGAEGILRQRHRRSELARLEATLEKEKAINDRLAAEIDGLQNDPLVKEKAIRQYLDYQRADETVIIVEESDPLAKP